MDWHRGRRVQGLGGSGRQYRPIEQGDDVIEGALRCVVPDVGRSADEAAKEECDRVDVGVLAAHRTARTEDATRATVEAVVVLPPSVIEEVRLHGDEGLVM